MRRKHILVADDEYNMLLTMQFILEVANYRVTTAEDGQEAMDKIMKAKDSDRPIDLLITDIQMPRLTGMELISELDRLGMDMPVLVITGHGTREMEIELMCKGCREYLEKPIDDEDLVERVAVLLKRKGEHINSWR